MYKLCKTEQSAARQRELEQGLLASMQSSRYEDINVSDLCLRMNVPRKSFYRYFSGKDGALHALIDHTLMEYESFTGARSPDKRTAYTDLEQFFHFWLSHKKLLDALQRSDISGILVERSIQHALTEGFFPGRFLERENRNVQDHVVSFAVCGLMTMMLQWHRNGFLETPWDLAQVAARLLTQPLFSVTSTML